MLPFRNLGNFVRLSHIARLLGETLKTTGPFSLPVEVDYPTQGNGKNLSWTHRDGDIYI